MGHQPCPVGAVTSKPKADVVIYAAFIHGLQSLFHHFQGQFFPGIVPVAQQEIKIVRSGEFGSTAKSTVLRVIDAG
jgi:hypothetical protein